MTTLIPPRACQFCGKQYSPVRNFQKYCCVRCSRSARCSVCGDRISKDHMKHSGLCLKCKRKQTTQARWEAGSGTRVVEGVTFILDDTYDVVAGKRVRRPIKICPVCGRKDRVSASLMTALRLGRVKGRCLSCAARLDIDRKPPIIVKHVEDTLLPSGSRILFAQRSDLTSRAKVPVVCGRCDEVRELTIRRVYCILAEGSPGFCQSCSKQHADYDGRYVDRYGYVHLHVQRLPKEWRSLAREMQRANGYVAEHRLMKALALGRPLRSDQFVHHKDLSTDANDARNLAIQSSKSHPTEHAAIPRRAQQELMRLYDLLDEHSIPHRKQFLRHLPWEYQTRVRQNYGASTRG